MTQTKSPARPLGLGLTALALGLTFSPLLKAETTAKHPMCEDGRAKQCYKMTAKFRYPADNRIDRIYATVDGTCNVATNDGGTSVASTEDIYVDSGDADDSGFTRSWWFPDQCDVFFHARAPQPTSAIGIKFVKDKIMTWKRTANRDRCFGLQMQMPELEWEGCDHL